MKGIHHIVIETKRVKYEFDIRRNITILQGDSATGKSSLLELLQLYTRNGENAGIFLSSDLPCFVYSGSASENEWKTFFSTPRGGILFVDEDYTFIHSKEFAECIRFTGDYYVLVTRRPLVNLPYSIQEIYGIHTSGRYHFPEQIYHEFYPIYADLQRSSSDAAHHSSSAIRSVILVEDSQAGFSFFKAAARRSESAECISSYGNSNVYQCLMSLADAEAVLVIADGAAFGAFVENVVALSETLGNSALYFPESFEWLLLNADLIPGKQIRQILEHPEDYADSSLYFSWEQYFTDLIQRETREYPHMRYQKSRLAEYYLTDKATKRILDSLPDQVRAFFEKKE